MKFKRNGSLNRITSHDVAELAGVSQSTVSRVLNTNKDNGFISKETADRVRAAANELGYSPNPIARALRGEKTNMIGLVVREIADPFFAGLIEIICSKARQLNYNVILGHVHSDPAEELNLVRILDSRQCDGIIFVGDLKNDQQVLQSYLSEKHPVVALCRGRMVNSLPTINCNNQAGIKQIIDYLVNLGHRRLTFIDGGWIGDIFERREVFLEYKNEFADGKQFNWLQAENNNPEGGYKAMRQLLKDTPRPTAVLASDDSMAIGVIKAVLEAGLRIPEDISVTGFDDIDFVKYITPSLTTVRQPIDAMANKAIDILFSQIEGKEDPRKSILIELEPDLVIRNSTGPVP